MPLKAVLDTVEGLDDTTKGFYREVTDDKHPAKGKFVLDVEPTSGFELDHVAGLKTALQRERATRESVERNLKQYEGIDPTEARSAFSKLEEFKNFDPQKDAEKIAQAKIEAYEKDLKTRNKREIDQRDAEIKRLKDLRRSEAKRSQLMSEIVAAKGQPKLLMSALEDVVQVDEREDGSFDFKVIDPATRQPRIKDGLGNVMSITDLLTELKSDSIFARAFDADKQPSGGGATPGAGSGNPPPAAKKRRTEMTPAEVDAFIKANGFGAYNALPM